MASIMKVCQLVSFVIISLLSHHVMVSTSQVTIDLNLDDDADSNPIKFRKYNDRPATVPELQLRKPKDMKFTVSDQEDLKVTRLGDHEYLDQLTKRKQEPRPTKLTVTDELFFELEITNYHGDGDHLRGNVTIACFGGLTPITCLNFVSIAKGYRKGRNKLTYKNGLVSKVVRDFMIQMGDTREGNNDSIFGKNFADESFAISHNHAGWVGMANFGRDSNGSQFYILLRTARWLDGKHVIFGKVINGMDLIHKIGEQETDGHNSPLKQIKIVNCGSLKLKRPYSLDESQFNTDGDIERVEGDEIEI